MTARASDPRIREEPLSARDERGCHLRGPRVDWCMHACANVLRERVEIGGGKSRPAEVRDRAGRSRSAWARSRATCRVPYRRRDRRASPSGDGPSLTSTRARRRDPPDGSSRTPCP